MLYTPLKTLVLAQLSNGGCSQNELCQKRSWGLVGLQVHLGRLCSSLTEIPDGCGSKHALTLRAVWWPLVGPHRPFSSFSLTQPQVVIGFDPHHTVGCVVRSGVSLMVGCVILTHTDGC